MGLTVTTPTSLHPPSREAIMGSIRETWVTLGPAMIAQDLLCLIISKVVRARETERQRERERQRETEKGERDEGRDQDRETERERDKEKEGGRDRENLSV